MPDYTHLLDPLLTWIRVLIGCAVLLLAEALLLFTISWVHRRSWWFRLSALVPLAAGIGAALAQQQIYNSYLSVVPFVESSFTVAVHDYDAPGATQAISDASRLGWFIIIITALLVASGLLGMLRLLRLPQSPSRIRRGGRG